ncbi:hypothetical protein HMPREF0742_02492 [Rothia aeria F0184]|uniref:Uncharacterized protein n=1 Tax=Rothia aeria F0184 TaxID=888019 RepID=U7UXG5_9MICC|nr:hypothetical protein HMPREF0742_02492 [Rothia aeria F0184]
MQPMSLRAGAIRSALIFRSLCHPKRFTPRVGAALTISVVFPQ